MKSPLKFIRAHEYRRSRWKNGGGETAEIAVFPQGADFDGFGWRVSLARIETDGAFSVFPGIDRTLSILSDSAIDLDIAGHLPVRLDSASPPHFFPADAEAFARLAEGPVEDLNVMTRRGRFKHTVARHVVETLLELPATAELAMLVCQNGRAEISAAGNTGHLAAGECVVLDNGDGSLAKVGIIGRATVLAIGIWLV